MKSKVCLTCKNVFYKKPSDSKKYWNVKKYCSIKCSGTLIEKGDKPWNKGKPGKIGKDSPSYKGGKNISFNGYIRTLIPGTGSYKLEHRKIMEEHLGIKLDRTEQVYHKNGIKTDNRIENLELMNISKHTSYELKKQWANGTRKRKKN